jgi:biotin carboxyl carrier protein
MATYRLTIDGKEYEVAVGDRSGSSVQVTVNHRVYTVEIGRRGAPVSVPSPRGVAAPALAPTSQAPAAPVATGGNTGGDIRAPIAGTVLRVVVSPGQQVAAGATLLVLEAMKMENEINAPIAGVVASIAVHPDQQVRQGDPLLTITPA